MLARGKANKEIARELCIGQQTVKTYGSRIFDRLRVHSRTQAAAQALRSGAPAGFEHRQGGADQWGVQIEIRLVGRVPPGGTDGQRPAALPRTQDGAARASHDQLTGQEPLTGPRGDPVRDRPILRPRGSLPSAGCGDRRDALATGCDDLGWGGWLPGRGPAPRRRVRGIPGGGRPAGRSLGPLRLWWSEGRWLCRR
ncbi:response regulator transcription factor [Streptomyces dysideae]|uniref:response regulator transcription factor n=1 Tax=Streptomyces dysideae TaxID=909626 RepID=UPI001F21CB47|nr:LuxR C-terminal-related transcriptional regulator [Streptomyces dysideae]